MFKNCNIVGRATSPPRYSPPVASNTRLSTEVYPLGPEISNSPYFKSETVCDMSVNDLRRDPTDEHWTVQHGPNEASATFIFGNEDHTLGNSLRNVLMNRSETEFCGYSVPHPYEPKMNIRLQTAAGTNCQEVMKSGLKDLEETANILDDVFVAALKTFTEKK